MNPAIGHENKHLYEFGPFRLDPIERVLARNGERISLAPKTFDTLLLLVRSSGHVLPKDQLMKLVWPDTVVEENNLTQHISQLRRALGEGSDGHAYIETVPRLGYRFAERVTVLPAEESDLLITRRTSTHVVIHEEQEEEEIAGAQGAPSRQTEAEVLPMGSTTNDQGRASRTSAGARTGAAGKRAISNLTSPVKLMAFSATCLTLVAVASLWKSGPVQEILRPNSLPAVLDFAQLTHDGHLKRGPLLAEGEFVYFLEPNNSKNKLMRVPAIGGEPTSVLEMPAAFANLDDLSPSRRELLTREGTATDQRQRLLGCIVPGGPCRGLSGVTAYAAAWSPRDDRIIYTQGDMVFTAKSDGTDTRPLFAAPGTVVSLSSSLDGYLLRYLCEKKDAKAYQLWESRADGTHARLIFSNVQSDLQYHSGSWTPNAKYLFYTAAQDGRESLWALRAAQLFHGESRTKLNTGVMSISAVASAPDGKRIFAIGTLSRVEFLRLDPKSSNFNPFLAGVSADGLAFSRKGDWVAYTTVPQGALVRSRLDGTQKLQLTNGSQKVLLPAWSPDGTRIAYMARASSGSWNGPWKIYVVSSDGGAAEEVLPGIEDQGNPTWSPDGRSLIFAGVPWIKGFAFDSTAVYQLDLAIRKVATLPGSQGLWSPRWSPDGKLLVAEAVDSRKLLLFDFSKQIWTPLAEASSGVIGYTNWSHDSRFLFFNSYAEEKSTGVYRVDVIRRATIPVPAPEVPDQPILFGQWFALGPDDTPIVLHDISVHELFRFDLHLP